MQQFKFYISALYLSLFSRRFYIDLIANRRMLGFKYLLILSFIIAVPISFEIKYIIASIFPGGTTEEVAQELNYIEKQVPPVFAESSKLKIASDTNRNIVSKAGNLIAIFDVENKIDDLSSYEKILVINPETIRIKFSEEQGTAVIMTDELANSMSQYFIKEEQGERFNAPEFFSDLLQISRTPLLLIIFFSMGWFMVKYSLGCLAFSFVVGILLVMMVCRKTPFDFKQCFRIAVFTATPVALLEALSNALGGVLFSYTSLVYFITHLLYIHFALETYKRSKQLVI